MRNRYVYDVTLTTGEVERWNCASIEPASQGRLIIYDYGIIRIYGPDEWTKMELVEVIPVEGETS